MKWYHTIYATGYIQLILLLILKWFNSYQIFERKPITVINKISKLMQNTILVEFTSKSFIEKKNSYLKKNNKNLVKSTVSAGLTSVHIFDQP